MSKDKSKKWVISAPLFYNYAGILGILEVILVFSNSRIPKNSSCFLFAFFCAFFF
ncbi:hypothetical protein [Campylobacter sp.]|uniref:hypothetical protein n=1 Tax=Campylobacter sp. TaxID=205 RepID=UPI002AA905F5|nr:hypothetical protein [Campylobacter sp.]